MEELDLTDPIVTPEVTINRYHVFDLRLNIDDRLDPAKDAGYIIIGIKDEHRKRFVCKYEGQEAIDLIVILNKSNLTNNSMHKRILQKLQADGMLPPGSIVGQPDGQPVL